jgi:hypothetical protein
VLGALISLGLETLGGVLALFGGALVVIAAALGFPLEGSEDAQPPRPDGGD